MRSLLFATALLLIGFSSLAEEPGDQATEKPQATEDQGDGIDKPKTLSGMSILGNEEAPKSLVIVPWKSSELGDSISLSDTLDDRARPVDKEVFLRELKFYQIRAGADGPPDGK